MAFKLLVDTVCDDPMGQQLQAARNQSSGVGPRAPVSLGCAWTLRNALEPGRQTSRVADFPAAQDESVWLS